MRSRRQDLGLSIILVIQVCTLFLVAPLVGSGMARPLVFDVFRFGFATVAVLMIARTRFAAIVIMATFLTSLAVSMLFGPGRQTIEAYLFRTVVGNCFDLTIAIFVAQIAFGRGRVTVHRIMGAVILYLSIGTIFASFYRVSDLTLRSAFSGLAADQRSIQGQLIYFSLTALTTTGFGDIVPLHPIVRSLANLEAVIGQLFPATLLARLVTLHAAKTDKIDDASSE
jgi:Ion channel